MRTHILHGLLMFGLLLPGCGKEGQETSSASTSSLEEGLRFREPGKEWTEFLARFGISGNPSDTHGLVEDQGILIPIEAYFFQPETICGTDDRTWVEKPALAPWSGNCLLLITTSNGNTAYGTGWLMGPRLVITAGHCVHEGDDGDFYRQIEVIPGTDGSAAPFGSRVSTNFRAAELWKSAGKRSHDYGAILLDQPFDGAPFIRQPVVKSDVELSTGEVELAGYPFDKLPQQWFDSDPISQVRTDIIRYNLDTFAGQSGSAVTHGGAVVGIHNYGGCNNSATRITPAVLMQLSAWLEESNR